MRSFHFSLFAVFLFKKDNSLKCERIRMKIGFLHFVPDVKCVRDQTE